MNDDRDSSPDLAGTSEATLIVDVNKLRENQPVQSRDDQQAYLMVIAGPHVGKMFKVDDDTTVLGRSSKADIHVNDVGISRQHAEFVCYGEDVFIDDLDSANGTYLNGQIVDRRQQLQDGDKITLGSTTILKFTYHDELDESFQKEMVNAALRDGLTGAYNKSYFLKHLETEMAFALRHQTALSLIMLDIDHFKPVNDNYGHLAGDAILKRLTEIAVSSLRGEDIFARYGGEEFAIVSRGTPLEGARVIAERLRSTVERTDFIYDGNHIPITISMGIATLPDVAAQTPEDLIKAADMALYDAKQAGRNRVCLAR